MSVAAFFDRKLTGTAMLLSIVLALKQFVMNIRKCRAPRKAFPPMFEKHDAQMLVHFENPGPEYEGLYTGPGGADKRYEHKEAERQLLLGAMPPLLVGNYNELVITTGWVLFFSVAFPAGSFFCIFAAYMTVYIELEGMANYKQKNQPMSIRDIGVWLDYVETVSLIGVFCTTYIVIFTSNKLVDNLIPGLEK